MQTPMNWRIVLGGAFLGVGLFFALNERWIEAAWSAVFGIGDLGIVFAEGRPQLEHGCQGRVLLIGWAAVLVWLTLQLILR